MSDTPKSELTPEDKQWIEQAANSRFPSPIIHMPKQIDAFIEGAEYATLYEREQQINLINEARMAIIDLLQVANDDELATIAASNKGTEFLGKTKLIVFGHNNVEAERTELRNKVIDEVLTVMYEWGVQIDSDNWDGKTLYSKVNSLKTK